MSILHKVKFVTFGSKFKKHSAQDYVRDKVRDFLRLKKRSNILKSHTK